jgi:DNA-binding MarR family transcriptional regulator
LLAGASYAGRVANPVPLTPTEELFWRALMRIVLSLPRQLHNDMVRATGLTASEYTLIMSLSEAPNRQLRMADLADASGLSASRTTRLVDDLQSHGLVVKRTSAADGRSNLAELTSLGLTKLRSAWPAHVESVRSRALDHIPPGTLATTARALEAVAAQLEERRVGPAA